MGDWLLLTAQGSVPEQGAERDVLELGALDGTFTDWRRLPDSNIGGGYPIVVSDLVVYPFFTFTGKNDGRDAQTFPRGAVIDPATGTWQMVRGAPRSTGLSAYRLNVGHRTFVGGHLVDPRTSEWTRVAALPGGERTAELLLANTDCVFVWGGAIDGSNVADGYLLHP